MNISFQWAGHKITPEQKKKVEENIREEMPGLVERFPDPPDELVVSLFHDNPMFSSLAGSAATVAGKTLVKVTYSLTHPCLREYFYLAHSCSNDS